MHGRVTLSSGREADYDVDLRRITLSGLAAMLHVAATQGRRLDAFVVWQGGEGARPAAPRRGSGHRRPAGARGRGHHDHRRIADRDTGAGAGEKIEAEGVPYRFLYSLQELGLG